MQILSVILNEEHIRLRMHIPILKLAQLIVLIQEAKIIKRFEDSQVLLTAFAVFNDILEIFVVDIFAECFKGQVVVVFEVFKLIFQILDI